MTYPDFHLDVALDIGEINEDFDPKLPPMTGKEFLQRVVLETSKCKAVVVADIDVSRFKNQQTSEECVENDTRLNTPLFRPSLEWQQEQIAKFSHLRQKLARLKLSSECTFPLPDKEHEDRWLSFCLGDDGCLPLLTVILSMNHILVEKVLEYHVDWLETKEGFTEQQGRWLYALLACLEIPLLPDTHSVLRSLARECSSKRAALKSSDDPLMGPLTLFIFLVSKYFGQTDLDYLL